MNRRLLVGTAAGLWELVGNRVNPGGPLTGKSLTALARDGARTWAVVDGRALWETSGATWEERTAIDGPAATCLAPTPGGLLIGTEQAHLLRRAADALERIDSFEAVEGRDAWYTPWGDPADVRSIAAATDGTLHVNVHVGGVARSRDGGRSWASTVDIETDVHQVLAHPMRADVVLVAAAEGFGVSEDGGDVWKFTTAGLHAHYLRAVAVAGETVLVSASTGPGGRRSALYRKRLGVAGSFERCTDGLPTWFGDNIDTGCLVADGSLVVFGTEDGRVFQSFDGGGRWDVLANGLPPVRCLALR